MALDPRIPLMAQGMNLEPRSNALMRAAQLQGTQDTNALRQMQMQQMQQAAQQTMMERQAAAQREQSMMGYLQSMSGQAGPPQPFNPAEAAQRLGIDGASKLQGLMASSANMGRAKVARTVEIAGPDGKPMTVQLDEFGSMVGNQMPKPVQSQMVNTGGSMVPVNPYAQTAPIPMTLSPGQAQSDATARRGQNMTDARARERMSFDQQQAGAGAVKPPPKPLPTSALKMQQEALDAIGVVGGINADLKALEGQITDGTLAFGPVKNLVSAGKNMVGASDTQSRNFATFKSNMERLRNESLRLNTGVQTDGDAQRAWNELFQNINDTDLVKQRLQEIQRINDRGAELQRLKVDQVRMNYGLDTLDVTPQLQQKPALTGGGPAVGAVVDGYRFKGGNPADPKSWEKQ